MYYWYIHRQLIHQCSLISHVLRLYVYTKVVSLRIIFLSEMVYSVTMLSDMYERVIQRRDQIKTHGSESRGQEAGLRDEPVSYLQVAPL